MRLKNLPKTYEKKGMLYKKNDEEKVKIYLGFGSNDWKFNPERFLFPDWIRCILTFWQRSSFNDCKIFSPFFKGYSYWLF